jgi:hypothetical protein
MVDNTPSEVDASAAPTAANAHSTGASKGWFDRSLQVVQTVALLGALWIAWIQTEKLVESFNMSTWSTIASQTTELDKVFIDHPEIVPYIYQGVPISTDSKDYNLAYSVAVMVIDFMDNSTTVNRNGDKELFEPEPWNKYYEWQFKSSPLICDVVRAEAHMYGKDIVRLGLRHCPKAADRHQ